MKRWLLVLVAAVLLLSGCRAAEELINPDSTSQVSFYYLVDEDAAVWGKTGVLVEETRILTAEQLKPRQLLELYLQGPVEEGLVLPVSAQMQIKDVTLEEGMLSVSLSYEWNNMLKLDRKLAEVCLLQTCKQLPEVKQVRINGMILKESDYLLEDRAGLDDEVAVKIYFSDMSGRYLMKETRNRDSGTSQPLHEFVLNELLAGPNDINYLSALPEGTRLLGAELLQDICTVNFSEEFLSNMPQSHTQARLAVFSVVNSLTELTQVKGVRILCTGKEIRSYSGLDLSGILYRDEPSISNIAQSDAFLDATLYVPVKNGGLAPIPVSVRQAVGRMGVDAVLGILLSFKGANGYTNPFPPDTTVVSQNTKDGVCTVILNSAFTGDTVSQQSREHAIRSLVATLCSLEQVDKVHILVSDENFNSVSIGDSLTPEDEWFLQPQ